jgi:hypothetical protein
MRSLEQQLHEQDQELRELRKRVGKSGATTSLVRELSESGLPDAAIARLRKKLPATASASAIKAAIAEEKNYVRGVLKSGRSLELVDSYKSLGLSEKEAKIAAGVESAVENISESRQKLANAAKLLGLSDAESDVFSRI